MVKRRATALIVAAVLALMAGGAVVLYVRASNERSVRGQDAKLVWVSTSAIQRGTKMSAATKMLKQEYVPARSAPGSAVVALGDGKLVAASDIAAGEILMNGRFVDEAAMGPQVLTVPAGKVAVSAKLNDFQRVGAFVKPGDFVAVYQAFEGKATVLFSRAQILGAGALSEDADAKSDSQVPSAVMTLALSPSEASTLVAAANGSGQLQFALLPAGESVPGGK
jgi:Flp pilus assembly protein CpaB